MSTLSVDPLRALVWRILLFKSGGWSTAALVAYTRRPKATMRRKCADLEAAGIIERKADGWHLTQYGHDACEQLFKETLGIAFGQRVGYSPELIEKSAKISPVHEDARNIRFFPPIPLPNHGGHSGTHWP